VNIKYGTIKYSRITKKWVVLCKSLDGGLHCLYVVFDHVAAQYIQEYQ